MKIGGLWLPMLVVLILWLVVIICLYNAFGEELTASWYSVESCQKEGTWQKYGGCMANGQILDDSKQTCSSWDYPFGTALKVTNKRTGRSVVCIVTDRGPARKYYRKGRVLDLSKAAFLEVADLEQGVIPVNIEVI